VNGNPNPADIAARLASAGLCEAEASRKGGLFARCITSLPDPSGARSFFIPGRIEVLGKHTDYAGGRSILAAADRGFCMAATRRPDSMIRIADILAGEQVKFPLHADIFPTPGHWSNYPMTVARRVALNFPGELSGVDIAFASDLPAAAGMSSSSAFVTGTFMVISAFNSLSSRDEYLRNVHGPESLAAYLGTIENGQDFGSLAGDRGVGTFGGSEDHTAMLCCRPGSLSQYSFAPVRFERTIPMPEGFAFAIASSGIAAEKTGTALEKYNRASRLASAAAVAWRESTSRDDPHIGAALSGYGPGAEEYMRNALKRGHGVSGFRRRDLLDRFNQFARESGHIIPAAGDALLRADFKNFGRLVDASQHFAEKLLRNQVRETIYLAKKARRLGAAAASAFGAGFGGAVWALAEERDAERFIAEWAAYYRKKYPRSAERSSFFITRPGPAAFEL
jgi:galactokinase